MSDDPVSEVALRPDDEFFKSFFDEAPDMFASVAPETAKIKYCNNTLCERLGWSKDELVGKHLKDLYHPDSHDEMTVLFEQFVATGSAESKHLQLVTKTGDTVDVSLRVSSHRDSTGKVTASRSVWREISLELQVTELELELRIQEAQKMESLALLAGGIAHDFNNMLVSILGNASLSLLELSHESPAVPLLRAIETAAIRAADLTKQLLAYSGSANHEQSVFDLSAVVEEMGHLLSVAISRKVVLNYDLSGEKVLVRGDITQVRQVVMNLLTNGSEAIGDRSGMITIRTGLQSADSDYLNDTVVGSHLEPGYFGFLEISDTGHGIAGRDQKRMFDPFFTTKSSGHGLGLAAVVGIVRSHKGALRVYSELNNGTTIKILLPSQEYMPQSSAPPNVSRIVKGKRILLVDDEENVLAVTKRMLEHYGFRVVTATDGRKAVTTYLESTEPFAAVLMDMTMPHMGGVEAFKEIVKIDSNARIVLMSGHSAQQATNALTGRSFRGFLQKPFKPDALLRTIFDAMESTP